MPPVSRILRAIVFADMVGYTALMGRDETLAIQLRRHYRTLLEAAVARWDGEIVQYYGDGALCLFASAVQATDCFLELQRALHAEPQVPVRVGIHVADVVRDEEGVWGNGVNIASRVQALCVPGGIFVSGRVGQDLESHPRVRTKPLGPHRLKNVEHPIEILAVLDDAITVPQDEQRVGAAQSPPRTRDDRHSVAVLPFVSMSADSGNEFFSDGITEEIINALAEIKGIDVTSRTSSFAFKGRQTDIRGIAQELGVTTVLEGSVRQAGTRVRVTAQLIDASTGYHLFAKNFDRDLEDIFAIQDEISGLIADSFRSTVVGEGRGSAVDVQVEHPAPQPRDPEALALYLRARGLWHKWTPEAVADAVGLYERAIELDPDLARAYAGMATALQFLAVTGRLNSTEGYQRAQRAASQGLMVDERSAESHQALGVAALFFDWNAERAKLHFDTALELAPGSAEVRQNYAMVRFALLDVEESLRLALKALELDPLSPAVQVTVVRGYLAADRVEHALDFSERLLAEAPEFRAMWEMRGAALAAANREEEALAAFAEYRRLSPTPHAGATWLGVIHQRMGNRPAALQELDNQLERARLQPEVNIDLDFAGLYAALGEEEMAFEHIERAIEQRTAAAVFLYSIPFFFDLYDHPRFIAAADRVGLWKGVDHQVRMNTMRHWGSNRGA